MKIKLNKTDEAYFWFTQWYQMIFDFEDEDPYNHCNKLFNKWWKLHGRFLHRDDIDHAIEFLYEEEKKWLEDLEARWAVVNLLAPLNNE